MSDIPVRTSSTGMNKFHKSNKTRLAFHLNPRKQTTLALKTSSNLFAALSRENSELRQRIYTGQIPPTPTYLAPTNHQTPIDPSTPSQVSPTTLGHVNQIFGTSMTTQHTRKMTRPERRHQRLLLTHKDPSSQWNCWRIYYTCVTLPCLPILLDKIGGMHDPRVQRAWREKVGLCSIILLMCLFLGFLTFGFVKVACDRSTQKDIYDASDIPRWNNLGEDHAHRFIIRGNVYDFSYGQYSIRHATLPKMRTLYDVNSIMSKETGKDLTMMFPVPTTSCDVVGIKPLIKPCWPDWMNSTSTPYCHDYTKYPSTLDMLKVGRISFSWMDIQPNVTAPQGTIGFGMSSSGLMVYNGRILDMKFYLSISTDPKNRFFGEQVHQIITTSIGSDVTVALTGSSKGMMIGKCLEELYMVGYLDTDSMGCIATDVVLNVSLVVILGVVLVRFFMALTFEWTLSWQLGRLQDKTLIQENREKAYKEWQQTHEIEKPIPPSTEVVLMKKSIQASPERYELAPEYRAFGEIYTVLLVTTYSEGEDSCRTTLDSLAKTTYSDSHKLLFIVSDGMITGSGNGKSTPELLIDMLELDPRLENPPQPVSYLAIADGSKRHNRAQVYAGHYVTQGEDGEHRVPVVLIVKCGTEEEENGPKPGNRGKRDSQIILMNFFQHVLYDDRLSPLEYDLFSKIRFVTGVGPDRYEIVLMVDADTKVAPDALSRMVAAMASDEQVIGLCGETRIGNKTQSWVTRIQVFEYYISHHLTKSFESMFGGVTCLPGCFCMWRIKSWKEGGWVPIVSNPDILMEYSQTQVETLHEKNLLYLGEDRFLTTLMLKTFPTRKLIFVPRAYCKTTVPDTFKILLSQRRRWINSTIHNLMELVLVRELCGTFCFSMQFLIFIELVGTVVLPAAITFTGVLVATSIYNGITGVAPIEVIPLLLLFAILGLPAFLILLTTKRVVYVYWMFVYLLALPIWNFILPAYAYWHFDDFSWGATRKVAGETKDGHGPGQGQFDSSQIPQKKWSEWEKDRRRYLIKNSRPVDNGEVLPKTQKTVRYWPNAPTPTDEYQL